MYTYRILENYSNDMFHSSILQFDKESYLFNCGDGTQRNALDQGIKFSKIQNVFYNSSHSNTYLGTYGFVMSRGEQTFSQFISKSKELSQKISEEKITKFALKNKIAKSNEILLLPQQVKLFGPPMFSKVFLYSNYFCPVPLGKSLFDFDPSINAFKNNNIFTNVHLTETYSEVSDKNVSIIPICTSDAKKENYAMSYIAIPTLKKRPFLKEKAKELGLKPGPLYAKLANGESVTNEEGKIIHPDDVLGISAPSSSVIILYIPSKEHMVDLINNKVINDYIANHEKKHCITAIVVTITPRYDIINNEEYAQFMSKFGKDVQHVIDCKETNRKYMYNEGKMKIQVILNRVNSYLFPHTKFNNDETLPQSELTMKNNNAILISDSVPGREYILYPQEKRGISNIGLYSEEPFYYKSENYNKYIKQLEKFNIGTLTLDNVMMNDIKKNEPRVTFLGTTSMKPCKYRNVTSILISLPYKEGKYVMFDCGEGTYQQILSQYGLKETNEILSKLSLISISHKHGDHMLGLLKIIYEIDNLLNNVTENDFMYIIVPNTIYQFICHSIDLDITHKSYFKVFECDAFNPNEVKLYQKNLHQNNPHENFTDIPREKEYKVIKEKLVAYRNKHKDLYNDMKNRIGVYFYAIEVFHCDESFGCFIENAYCEEDNENYFKISFSGDTRPINNFFNYTMNSSLLIHEGTFDDEMINDAKDKMHSTIKEAIELGKQNGSKHITLTHFSPRYIKTYPFMERFETEGVLLAHDYLTFYLSDLNFAFKYLKFFDEVIKKLEEEKESIL